MRSSICRDPFRKSPRLIADGFNEGKEAVGCGVKFGLSRFLFLRSYKMFALGKRLQGGSGNFNDKKVEVDYEEVNVRTYEFNSGHLVYCRKYGKGSILVVDFSVRPHWRFFVSHWLESFGYSSRGCSRPNK